MSNTPAKTDLQQQSVEQLNSMQKNAPSWSLGIAAILSAFVAFILALGLDVGGITDKWFTSNTELQMQELLLKQKSLENEVSTISVLQEALSESSIVIGELKGEVAVLKQNNYQLSVDFDALKIQCEDKISLLPIPTPTLK